MTFFSSRRAKPVKRSPQMIPALCSSSNQWAALQPKISIPAIIPWRVLERKRLDRIGNVGLREDERLPWNPDDALVWTATNGWRQVRETLRGHVDADDGKITVLQR